MKNNCIKTITQHQKEQYEYKKGDVNKSNFSLDDYNELLKKVYSKKKLMILDIGGGNGVFALSLLKHFTEKRIEADIWIVDPIEYNATKKCGDDIHFVKESASNLSHIFQDKTFDLIFSNNVFHHFVSGGWRTTTNEMLHVMVQIKKILKDDGFFLHNRFYL